jgi:acyl carrier protein
MIGGEAFPVAQARELASITNADIINMYGPTETTIWSSTAAVSGDERTISIGRPVANTQFYILDPNLAPVPVGVPGELYIGGAGVVRGYYHRDELTAERFIKNPFVEGDEARIYNTGDIARWTPDGRVDFLGRADHQVKIRGYRVELGEIETQLTGHESVREAVVIAREDTPGDVRLVAYVIPSTGVTTDAESFRTHLREKLPEYMIPARYVEMETFPFTPNNKIDRNALPAIEESIPSRQQKPEAVPTNEIEKTILDIWHEVLGTSSAGIEDNFFDLGGHSLLAVQAHRKLTAAIESKITIVDLFRYPTVKALAAYIGNRDDGENLSKSEDRGQARRKIMANRRQARGRPSKSD